MLQALDAARGLLYLHNKSIVHRDVKSPNLLVDEHYRVKVHGLCLDACCHCAGDLWQSCLGAPCRWGILI